MTVRGRALTRGRNTNTMYKKYTMFLKYLCNGPKQTELNSSSGSFCTQALSLISSRVGLPISKAFGMEEVLMKYSVDVAVWAHEHEYERTWPLYDYRYAITMIIGY